MLTTQFLNFVHIISPWLIYIIIGNLYLLTPCPFHQPPLAATSLFSPCLGSRSIMPSSSIQVAANDKILLSLWLNNILFCACMCACIYTYTPPIFVICSFSYGHLGCFRVLAPVGNAAVNVGVKLMLLFPPARYPEVELLDHLLGLFLIFWEPPVLLSTVAAPVYMPTNSAQGFPFLHILTNTCCFLSFL